MHQGLVSKTWSRETISLICSEFGALGLQVNQTLDREAVRMVAVDFGADVIEKDGENMDEVGFSSF